jgi:uncharacterized protein (TIGR00730 family)
VEKVDVNDPRVLDAIHQLIGACGGDSESFEGELISQLIQTSLRLMTEGHDTGQLKLISRALKEMRYAYGIFNKYNSTRRISIFGSARTPEDHPDYEAAKRFSAGIAEDGWMCITGAANGIMKAGLEGPKKESSFGLSIRLPFEIPTNSVIEGDPKLIIFRYFFTRKLMFISHSDAVAVFPGGFGTLDELFEVLTLIQTGKANIMPVVLVEGEGGIYWEWWNNYVQQHLLTNGWISEDDQRLFYVARGVEDAIKHVQQFYYRYHSSRYVKNLLVIRMKILLSEEQINILNEEFKDLIQEGKIYSCKQFPEEKDALDLPRIAFHHTKMNFARLRMLIDRINEF